MEGFSRYLKNILEQAIHFSGRIMPQDEGTMVESRVKACFRKQWSETCHRIGKSRNAAEDAFREVPDLIGSCGP